MTIEIKHKITGEVLLKVEAKNLRVADLSWADLREADLSWAYLRDADLSWADLREANLIGADLRGAKGTFTFNFGVKLKIVEEEN